MDFTGRTALVTGGGNGIGRAACVTFAAHGAAVVVVDRDGDAARETAELVGEEGGTAIAVSADVTSSADVQAYVAAAIEAFGHIDCFVNNAGIGGRVAPTAEYDEDDFDAVIAVNLKGAFLGLRHVLPHMIARGRGAVVTTASVAGILATPGAPAYVASKHAVIGLTKAAAGEVARHGVRVNAVCPGPVDTAAMRRLEEQFPGDPEETTRRNRAAQPTGRYSTPEEVANVMLFLCSDLASNVNGAQYVVDGGRSATGSATPAATAR